MGKNSDNRKPLASWKKVPGWVLHRVCDAYVRGITSCAGGVPHGASIGFPAHAPANLPEGWYNGAAMSARKQKSSSCNAKDARDSKRESSFPAPPTSLVELRRKYRGMDVIGRIDEDKPCEFHGDDDVKVGSYLLLPRIRSKKTPAASGR